MHQMDRVEVRQSGQHTLHDDTNVRDWKRNCAISNQLVRILFHMVEYEEQSCSLADHLTEPDDICMVVDFSQCSDLCQVDAFIPCFEYILHSLHCDSQPIHGHCLIHQTKCPTGGTS